MIIQAQICGIVLVLVILTLCLLQRKIDLRAQKLFRINLLIVLVSIVLDAYSIILIQGTEGVYGLRQHIACKSYLMSLVIGAYTSFLYLTVELEAVWKKMYRIKRYAAVFMAAGCLCIAILPISFYLDESSAYTYGPSVNITYFFSITFIILNIIILLWGKGYIHHRRRIAGLVWMAIWIMAALIQLFNNELLLVGYASAIGVGILFMRLENPEGYLDRRTGLLNQQALCMYMQQNYARYGNFSMMVVSMDDGNYADSPFEEKQWSKLSEMMAEYLDSMEKTVAFKNSGWEYTLLFREEKSMAEISEKILQRFQAPWNVEGKNIYINIRLFQVPDCSLVKDTEKLLEFTRFFVSDGKKYSSQNIMVMDQEWIEQVQENVKIGQHIDEAIEEDRIQVFYQPIYSTQKGYFVSAEALVRIRNKDGSFMSPVQFIPVAEKNGAILQLGEIVFYKVCRLLQKENLKEKGIQYLEINLSAVQCVQLDLAERFIQIMQETKVDPAMINLEITESATIKSKEILLQNMEKLQTYGVSFSLDDFGTGYSNLNYILELPVQIVKFDRKMTMSYFDSEKGKMIMEAAIRMVKAMQIHTVAEGVEQKEQLDKLEQLKIDYIQGFYFSKPLPEAEFLALLEKSREGAE